MNISLILSGGTGNRFGNDLPKQYHEINNKQIIAYSIDAIKSSKKSSKIIVVSSEEYIEKLKHSYNIDAIAGGQSRNESLRIGLEYIKGTYSNCEKIFINEAARPFITPAIVDKYFNLLNEYDSVITTQYITDSLGCNSKHITDRSEYYLVQAPESFKFSLLFEHFKADSPITATYQQMPIGSSLYKNYEFRNNFKITYSQDLAIAKQLIKNNRNNTK
jgi:2-C-methyl-D-erythritol 4-phosphate cytidylyltransferase